MLQNYKKTKQGQSGFTIVELLIVIVVIAILAAITIVAYNGVTTSARSSKAVQNAQNVQSVAEAINADKGYYPITTSEFNTLSTITKIPSGLTLITNITSSAAVTTAFNALSSTAKENTVIFEYCGAVAAPASGAATGGRIRYWDFSATTPAISTNIIYVGVGASGLGVGAGTVCNTWVPLAS